MRQVMKYLVIKLIKSVYVHKDVRIQIVQVNLKTVSRMFPLESALDYIITLHVKCPGR